MTTDLPTLRSPMLILAFEGWNDAGDAATMAELEALECPYALETSVAAGVPADAIAGMSALDGGAHALGSGLWIQDPFLARDLV